MSFGKGFTKIRFSKIRENPAGKNILARQNHFKPVPPLGTPVRKSYSREEGEDALEKLNGFLDEECPEQAYFLVRVWDGQQKAITYKELKAAIINGYMGAEVLEKWQKDYSAYVEKHLVPGWYKAMEEAGKNFTLAGGEFRYDPMWTGITDWVKEHSAEFVTNCVQEQREAISGLLANSFMNGENPDEMSRAVRPCIGLTAPQAAANQRYYNHVKSTLMKENPKMAEATAAKKALEKSTQYAAEQHRYRAQVIATTEMAHAYNEGHLQAAKMAQTQGLLGRVQNVWSTANDEMVCPYCGGLEGTVIDLDDKFQVTNGKRSSFALTPPAHPNCRCAFEVREVASLIPDPNNPGKYNVRPEELADRGVMDMSRNPYADIKQFENYQRVMGDEAPKTLEEFIRIKYTDTRKYGSLKHTYRIANQYEVNAGSMPASKIVELHDEAVKQKALFTGRARTQANMGIMDLDGLLFIANSKATYVTDPAYNSFKGEKDKVVLMPKHGMFKTEFIGHNRRVDSEAKLLEYAARIVDDKQKHTVYILSEKCMCKSCRGVKDEFIHRYQNVELNIVSHHRVKAKRNRNHNTVFESDVKRRK